MQTFSHTSQTRLQGTGEEDRGREKKENLIAVSIQNTV